MKIRRTMLGITAVIALGASLVVAPAAQAAPAGTTSLATVLAADGAGFDRNSQDFDILDNAVQAVLGAKPGSAVAVLADGTVPLTAFLPNDLAFRVLAHSLTKHWYGSESAVFGAIAGTLTIDQIEKVLLYHVVPGATIDAATALKSNGAVLATASAGDTLKVRVLSARYKLIQLIDGKRGNLNPFLNPRQLDLNKGNLQIAHGVTLVLLPAGF